MSFFTIVLVCFYGYKDKPESSFHSTNRNRRYCVRLGAKTPPDCLCPSPHKSPALSSPNTLSSSQLRVDSQPTPPLLIDHLTPCLHYFLTNRPHTTCRHLAHIVKMLNPWRFLSIFFARKNVAPRAAVPADESASSARAGPSRPTTSRRSSPLKDMSVERSDVAPPVVSAVSVSSSSCKEVSATSAGPSMAVSSDDSAAPSPTEVSHHLVSLSPAGVVVYHSIAQRAASAAVPFASLAAEALETPAKMSRKQRRARKASESAPTE